MITPVIKTQLNDAMKKRLEAAYKRASGSYTSVGIHEGIRGYKQAGAPTVGQVALWMEYGAPNAGVPARPFLSPAINENRGAIASNMGRNLAMIAYDKVTVEAALNDLGQMVKLFIQAKIQSGPGAPLSGSWDPPRGYLGRKRRLHQPSQTLIATRTMFDSVQYKVVLGSAAKKEADTASAQAPTAGAAHGPHNNGDRRARMRQNHLLKKAEEIARRQAGQGQPSGNGKFISRQTNPKR